MPAQILICIDDHLQIGDCKYDCEGIDPQCFSSLRRICCAQTLLRCSL